MKKSILFIALAAGMFSASYVRAEDAFSLNKEIELAKFTFTKDINLNFSEAIDEENIKITFIKGEAYLHDGRKIKSIKTGKQISENELDDLRRKNNACTLNLYPDEENVKGIKKISAQTELKNAFALFVSRTRSTTSMDIVGKVSLGKEENVEAQLHCYLHAHHLDNAKRSVLDKHVLSQIQDVFGEHLIVQDELTVLAIKMMQTQQRLALIQGLLGDHMQDASETERLRKEMNELTIEMVNDSKTMKRLNSLRAN